METKEVKPGVEFTIVTWGMTVTSHHAKVYKSYKVVEKVEGTDKWKCLMLGNNVSMWAPENFHEDIKESEILENMS